MKYLHDQENAGIYQQMYKIKNISSNCLSVI